MRMRPSQRYAKEVSSVSDGHVGEVAIFPSSLGERQHWLMCDGKKQFIHLLGA